MMDFTKDRPPTTNEERMKAYASFSRIERELGFVDESLAEAELPEPHFEGERYEDEVPDTLELTDNALFAINAYTRLLDPAMDYAFIGNVNFVRKPPVVIAGGPACCTSKQLESLVLMRVMTGSKYNIEMDNKYLKYLLHMTAKDGFAYMSWAKAAIRPHYLSGGPPGKDPVSPTRHPFTSVWEEGREVLAFLMWYQHDKNELWKELIEKKIKRISELAVWEGDICYFSRDWYLLSDKGSVEGAMPKGIMTLQDVMFIVAGCCLCYKLTGHEPALKLARGLVNRVMQDEEVFGKDGRWLTDHFHSNTAALIGILEYATTVGDQELVGFVKNSYEFGKSCGEPLVGYYSEIIPGSERYEIHKTCETCEVADMLVLGVKLTLAGAGDYWEDVDRCIRNQFVENQITSTDWVERITEDEECRYRDKDQPLQLWEDETDAVERSVGSWAGWAKANDGMQLSLMQCCAGNAGRSMYYVWDSIVTREDDTVKVNLHLNRASRWVDVYSHLPYEGKVVVKVKDAPNLSIRIPEWTEQDKVTCTLNESDQAFTRCGNYIEVTGLKKGDSVCVQFPMRERTLFREIGEETYRLTIKGNTVIDIDPEGKIYPLYQRDCYTASEAPMRKVTRFVSSDKICW